jgi:hypothetical protein
MKSHLSVIRVCGAFSSDSVAAIFSVAEVAGKNVD